MAGLLMLSLAAFGLYSLRWGPPGWQAADLAFVPFGLLYLIHALAPETTSDAISYHLGLPAEWLGARGFTGRPGFFETIPHGLETLFAAAIPLGGYPAAKLVHFSFFLATAPLIISTARGLGFDGRPAALLYFTSPVAAMAGTAAYNDAAAAFYALAVFYLLAFEPKPRAWAAGIAAGFCYAIKMSGGVVTLAAAAILLWRRSWPGMAGIFLMAVPWLAHSWWLTGNPVAPMLLDWFPGPAFHPVTIAGWTDYVRSYDTAWAGGERLGEVLTSGVRTQGLLGPGFWLAPLGLIGLAWKGPRRRAAALLMLAAGVSASAWLFNAGTRFLMPASIFLALAMMSSLPGRVAWGIAVTHAVLCWPHVLDRIAPPGAWRLPSTLPWAAALRLEDEADYLRRVSPPYRVAEMLNRHVTPAARGVLDLTEAAPRAYTRAVLSVPWQHTAAGRAAAALLTAHSSQRHVLFVLSGAWPATRLRSLRFEQYSNSPDGWSILEARLRLGGATLFPAGKWELDAWPNPWDAALAFDRNEISGWRTWQPRRDGMFIEVSAGPGEWLETDGVQLLAQRNEAGPRVRVTGVDATGSRVVLAERLEPAEAVRLNRRLAAMRYVRREGFAWVLTSPGAGGSGMDAVARSLLDDASDWGLERVASEGGIHLLRIRPHQAASELR